MAKCVFINGEVDEKRRDMNEYNIFFEKIKLK